MILVDVVVSSIGSKTDAALAKFGHLQKSRCNLEATKFQPVDVVDLVGGSEACLVETEVARDELVVGANQDVTNCDNEYMELESCYVEECMWSMGSDVEAQCGATTCSSLDFYGPTPYNTLPLPFRLEAAFFLSARSLHTISRHAM